MQSELSSQSARQEFPVAANGERFETYYDSQQIPSIIEQIGGFRFLKSFINGIENLDSRKRAVRQAFLSDDFHKDERKKLAFVLDLWINALEDKGDSVEQLVSNLHEDYRQSERCITDNLASVREEIKELEIAYRSLESFFDNVNKEKVDFVSIMNVTKSQLSDTNSEDTKAVVNELNDKYDKIDLNYSYSILLIPGYLGDADNVRSWAKFAHKNKTLLVTDFEDSYTYDELIQRLKKAYLCANDINLSHVAMACNYILARRRSERADEEDDLYIPSSPAIVGRMCDTEQIRISQGVAGKKFGMINEALSVRFDMLKSELALLIDYGVVPLIETNGRIYAFSNGTLYNGPIDALKEYTIVRVFDWVSKVVQQFCNNMSGNNWESPAREELTENIQSFLTKYKGSEQLYENYTLKPIVQLPNMNVVVPIEIRPFYAARNFIIELTGTEHKSKKFLNWEQSISNLQ